jgi:hypothetical protein
MTEYRCQATNKEYFCSQNLYIILLDHIQYVYSTYMGLKRIV